MHILSTLIEQYQAKVTYIEQFPLAMFTIIEYNQSIPKIWNSDP